MEGRKEKEEKGRGKKKGRKRERTQINKITNERANLGSTLKAGTSLCQQWSI